MIAPVPLEAERETAFLRVGYHSERGTMYWGTVEGFLESKRGGQCRGQVQLLFTSPPFPLNRKKRYGNRVGDEYRDWFASLSVGLREMLTPDGSIVIEMGNAWEPGEPVMSTLALRSLLDFAEKGELYLCQQFICHNPARLPSPAQWVNLDRSRIKDAFTHVWWLSTTPRPKADNRRVLRDYSPSMQRLLSRKRYNAGERPSGHSIGIKSFLADNGGAIPSNVLTFSNTVSNDLYRGYCRQRGIPVHPARMPPGLVDFFVRFLTDEDDLVFDPFAGSNTTGSVAEALGRRWVSVEPMLDYVEGSQGRFGRVRPGAVFLDL